MCPSTLQERREHETDENTDDSVPENLSRRLIHGISTAALEKAEKDWHETIRWWTRELQTKGMPIDLRLRAAAALSDAVEKAKLNKKSGVG